MKKCMQIRYKNLFFFVSYLHNSKNLTNFARVREKVSLNLKISHPNLTKWDFFSHKNMGPE